MAKAARKLDGWTETRRPGSRHVLANGARQRIRAYPDGVDLGGLATAAGRP